METLLDLVTAWQDQVTRGYDVDVRVKGRAEHGFMVIDITDTDPQTELAGQWWLDANGRIIESWALGPVQSSRDGV